MNLSVIYNNIRDCQKDRNVTAFFIFLLALCLQIPELKIGEIKSVELLGLCFLIKNSFKINKREVFLIGFFCFFLIVTLIRNHYFNFTDVSYDSKFKVPNLISIARCVEYISCIGIVVFVRIEILTRLSVYSFIQLFLKYSFYISIGILIIGGVLLFGFNNQKIIYFSGNCIYRLRGFFYEGGPYGLYNAFLFCLYVLYGWRSKKIRYFGFLFLIYTFLALSKAGVMELILFSFILLIKFFVSNRNKGIFLNSVVLLGVLLLVVGVYFIFNIYTKTLFNHSYLLKVAQADPNNYWINGGRVPGFYIVQEMIHNNFLLGIGMGNYQLLRNSTEFLSGFPITYIWDYHGYGGVTDLLVEFGILGLLLFGFGLYICKFSFSIKNIICVLPWFLGLPLYFHYTWAFLFVEEKKT